MKQLYLSPCYVVIRDTNPSISLQTPWLQEKFVCQLEVIIKRSATKSITVESEWLSEKEMREELKWTPCFGANIFLLFQKIIIKLTKSDGINNK